MSTDNASTAPVHAVVPTDERVKKFILSVLDDYKRHDWDDAMIEVDQGFEKHGERLGPRQAWKCLDELIASGQVAQRRTKWDGFFSLQRVATIAGNQKELFSA